MEPLHSLLKRQLLRSFGDSFSIPEEWQGFIRMVNDAYQEADIDREMLERSLDLSSQELIQANSEMRAIFQAIPDLLFQLDSDGTIIDCKAGSTNDFVLMPRELVGKRIKDVPLRSVSTKFHEAIRQVNETKSIASIEYSLLIGDKKHFYEARLVPLFEGRIISIIRNITKDKLSEDALKESEEKYRNLVERANDGIIIIQDGIIRYANPASIEIWGGSIEEIVGRPFTDFIDPKEIPRVVEHYQRRMANESVTPIYETILGYRDRRDRAKIFVELNAGLIAFQGKPADLVIIRDITERKLTEKMLLYEKEKAQQYLDIVGTIVIAISVDHTVSLVNQAGCRLLGYREEEIVGKNWFRSFLPEETRPEVEKIFEKLIAGIIEPVAYAENLVLTRNGEKRIVAWHNTILRDESGNITGTLSSGEDISERVKMEEELLRSRNELEERVRERTAELEAKNREMERFIYTVSHDLRSTLISVSGFLGLLKQDAEKGDLKRMNADLRIANEAVTKMDQLLMETLELSRIGRVVNPPEDVLLGEIVEDAIGQTSKKIGSNRFDVSVAQNLPIVHVDRMRITEVLVNLIENSIKYMGLQANPEIEIGQRIDGKDRIFFVRDNGIGIDLSQHDKVFELFYKVVKKSEGAGAGLAIVKRIIEVHGGRIWIESMLGQGCTVCFTLPLANVG